MRDLRKIQKYRNKEQENVEPQKRSRPVEDRNTSRKTAEPNRKARNREKT